MVFPAPRSQLPTLVSILVFALVWDTPGFAPGFTPGLSKYPWGKTRGETRVIQVLPLVLPWSGNGLLSTHFKDALRY